MSDNKGNDSDGESISTHHSTQAGKTRSIMKVLSDPKTKKKRTGRGVVGDYKRLAQWIGRSEDTFIDFDLVFHIGMECEGSDNDIGDDDASTRTDTEREDDNIDSSHYQHVFMIISENIPTFELDLKKFKKNPRALENLCGQMTLSLGFAHSDDIRILREDGLNYVAATQPTNDLMPEVPPHSSKPTYHGWNHPVLAKLLTIQDFMNGSLRVTADQLCLLMYRNYSVNYENLMDGLLCSDLIKMMRWFLCGVEDWRKNNGKVDKQMLYYTIINLFKRKNMKIWSKGVLQEWNKEMFQKKKTYETCSASLLALYEQSWRQSLSFMSTIPASTVNHTSSPPAAPGASHRSQSPASVRVSRPSPSTTTRATHRQSPPTPNNASHPHDTVSPPPHHLRPPCPHAICQSGPRINLIRLHQSEPHTCISHAVTPIYLSIDPTCGNQCLTSISFVCVCLIIASITTQNTTHLSICEPTPSDTVFQHRVTFNHTYRDHQ
ncbi:hypothetical protein BGW80DRAFT_1256363 [Lactifluus volemus]|nr:hypothetical protein BGW80DRAFT_1256363 [Lactifluus volemus]